MRMQKTRFAFPAFALATALGLLLVAGRTASADPAIVIKNDGLCGIPGADADGNIIFGGIGQVTTLVENDNKVTLICKGVNITNLTGKAANFKGFNCGIVAPSDGGVIITDDSQVTISASGEATLKCTYTKP